MRGWCDESRCHFAAVRIRSGQGASCYLHETLPPAGGAFSEYPFGADCTPPNTAIGPELGHMSIAAHDIPRLGSGSRTLEFLCAGKAPQQDLCE